MFTFNTQRGCHKCSTGCDFCLLFNNDKDNSGNTIRELSRYKPIGHHKDGTLIIPSYSYCVVNTTSDTFIEEADSWRYKLWEVTRKRQDMVFAIFTKYVERVSQCLPSNWGSGDPNIELVVSCENQELADKRLPILLSLPFKHKSISITPCLGPIALTEYLKTHEIDYVYCSGEYYNSSRVLDFDWVKSLHDQCLKYNTNFIFERTGNYFKKDGIVYKINGPYEQRLQAYHSNVNLTLNDIKYKLYHQDHQSFADTAIVRYFNNYKCPTCSKYKFCYGCHQCSGCKVADNTLAITDVFPMTPQN